MATEKQQMTADAGDLPVIDFGQQMQDLQAAVPKESDPKRRAILEKDLAHVSGVNELLQMKPSGGGDGAAPTASHKAGVDELLAMPKLADTSDPAGNKDRYDVQIDKRKADEARYDETMSPGSKWFRTAAKAMMPTEAGKQGVDSALNVLTPRGMAAAGRGMLTHIVGAPGDFENAFQSTGEALQGVDHRDPALEGHRTALPTSEEVSQGLSKIGLKPDPYRQGTEQGAGVVASLALPVAVSQAARVPGAMRTERLGNEAREAVQGAAQRGQQQIVGQHPLPVPQEPGAPVVGVQPQYPQPRAPQPQMPDIPPSYPQPRAPEAPLPVPQVPAPVARTAPNTLGGELEGHIAENEARLGAAKGARWEQYQQELAAETKPVDINDVIDKTTTKAAKSEKSVRVAMDKANDSLKDIRDNTDMSRADKITALHNLKRQMAEAGKDVADASGYAALKGNVAKSLEKDINAAIKSNSPAYERFTKDYQVLSAEAEPLDRTFLKGVGESEGTTSIATALRDPKNVDSTIAAMGPGGAEKLDTLAVKHVQNQLGRKSGQQLEDAITDLGPSLEKLPQAREAAQQLLNGDQLKRGIEGAAKTIEQVNVDRTKMALGAQRAGEKAAEDAAATANAARAAQRKAATSGSLAEQKAANKAAEDAAAAENALKLEQAKNQTGAALKGQKQATLAHEGAQETAKSYTPLLNNLQQDVSPARRIKVLRQMNDKMLKDGLIGDAEHAGFGAQIEKAANAAEKQQALQTLSKYVAYTLTGNYMISFGGPHLVSYLAK